MRRKILPPPIEAILIDPHDGSVSPILLPDMSLETLYRALAIDTVEVIDIGDDHILLVDECGMLKPNAFFDFAGVPNPVAGPAIVAANVQTPDGLDWGRPSLNIAVVASRIMRMNGDPNRRIKMAMVDLTEPGGLSPAGARAAQKRRNQP